MIVISSSFQESDFQTNGSRTVTERITMDNGLIYGFVWQGTANAAEVLAARVLQINALVQQQEIIDGIVENTRIPLTKYEFRSLFTYQERKKIDEFNANFELNALLTADQKADIRTGLKDFESALNIAIPFLDSVISMLNLYSAIGILTHDRAMEIIAKGEGLNNG